MKERNSLHLTSPQSANLADMFSLDLAETGLGAIDLHATRARPGHFNDKATVRLSHAQAVQVYLWLGEVVGKEGQP